ncbi:MAG: TIGR03086 family metal-binding protein [Acidimicrobiia bacterium]
MDTYQALHAAISSTRPIVQGTTPAQFDRPTPCTAWDVRALLNHIVGTLWSAQALLTDTQPPHGLGPGGLPDTDLVGDNPIAAYKEGAAAARAAAGAGEALEESHQTPLGEMPGAGLAGFASLDLLVHGWDLARATGQAASFDEELVAHCFGFAQQVITDQMRGPLIGSPVPVPDAAPPIERLAGFMGRHP